MGPHTPAIRQSLDSPATRDRSYIDCNPLYCLAATAFVVGWMVVTGFVTALGTGR